MRQSFAHMLEPWAIANSVSTFRSLPDGERALRMLEGIGSTTRPAGRAWNNQVIALLEDISGAAARSGMSWNDVVKDLIAQAVAAGGGFTPVWKPLRIADAESGDTSTPGYDAQAGPSTQFVSASEDAAGITLTVRNRGVAADHGREGFGWILPLPSDVDPSDLDFSILFRITPITPFTTNVLAVIGAGVVDRDGDILNAASFYFAAQLEQVSAGTHRHGIGRFNLEGGVNGIADTIPVIGVWKPSANRIGNMHIMALDASGNNVYSSTVIHFQVNASPNAGYRFFIWGGVENIDDTVDSTGKYNIEYAVVPRAPAGTF